MSFESQVQEGSEAISGIGLATTRGQPSPRFFSADVPLVDATDARLGHALGMAIGRWIYPADLVSLRLCQFTMAPVADTVARDGSLTKDSRHGMYSDKAIVRSFLTAALQAINLANVRGFLTADEVGDPIATL
jgi:hypothetical protein